ncbi:YkvA family protein [Marinobacter caseinilyticus]|uniref:YkvA family protein n=1 Tax=Marinobacter caseinilyticus TaxID=2692195 RepID=UPI00140CC6D0|nr:YkvA family protein [Marinobacter caseinilyticus]
MSTISNEQAESALQAHADDVNQRDLSHVLSKRAAIEAKAQRKGPLRRFLEDIQVMFSMLGDYWNGRYRAVPWMSIAAIAGALLYVLNPIDLIPDLIVGFGLFDDAAVLAACLSMVESDLATYAAWKHQQSSEEDPA